MRKFRRVFDILKFNNYQVMMVSAKAGDDFGTLIVKYLNRLRQEDGILLAVCSESYGEMTSSAYSTYDELKYAVDNKVEAVPLKVCQAYPPTPPSGPSHKFDKQGQALGYISKKFSPSVAFLNCVDKTDNEIARMIAEKLLEATVSAGARDMIPL